MERYKEVLLLPRRQFYVHFYVNRAASSPVARDHWGIFELIIKESGDEGSDVKGRKSEASRHSPLALYAPSHHPSLALLACSRVPQSPLSPLRGGSQQGSILKWLSFKNLPSHNVEIILCCEHQHCFSACYVSGFDVFLIL